MRITWSVPVFSQGLGSGRGDLVRARALIRALRAAGHDVRVVEARERPGAEVEQTVYREVVGRLLPGRARLALRDAAWWWRSRGHGRRVADAARDQGADVLVETQVHGVVSGIRAARAADLPLVLDDTSPPTEADQLGAGVPGLAGTIFRRQCAAVELLVAPTRGIRDRIAATLDGSPPVEVIPNGVDQEAHDGASRRAGRRALGIGDEVLIAFVGSFQPWHRVPHLVRAFAALDTAAPARLLLVGDGPDREPALSEARERGIEDLVLAPGAVPPDRIPDLLAASDVGALAGTNDYGHPMKLLEYAAAGLPLVAPDLPPVRDVAEGVFPGVLVPPGDVLSLARAMGRLVEDPEMRLTLGGQARTRVARSAGWGPRARTLAEALERVTAASGGERGRPTRRPAAR